MMAQSRCAGAGLRMARDEVPKAGLSGLAVNLGVTDTYVMGETPCGEERECLTSVLFHNVSHLLLCCWSRPCKK